MPSHEIALPAGSKNLSPALPTITRHSKDGDIPVIRLFGGDNFVGDTLEGHWLKGDDGVIIGPFTVMISSGQLEMTGRAAVAASVDYGHISGQIPILMVQNAYVDVHLKLPAVTPANDVGIAFALRASKSSDSPLSDDDVLYVNFNRTSSPVYQIRVLKVVNNSETVIYAWTTVTNEEGTFRFKFRPDDDKMDIYFHDGAGDVVESTDELTLSDDTLDLAFDVGYAGYVLRTFDAVVRTCISEKVEVSYPDFDVNYDLSDEAFQGEGSELLTRAWDTSGNVKDGTVNGATWVRDGKFGKALEFDGIDDYVAIPSATYDLSSTTFAFWAKRYALATEGAMAIMGNTSTQYYRYIIFASTGNLQLETDTNDDAVTGLFTDDKDVWHHYAIVCDNYVVTLYEDGIDITTGDPNLTDDITLNEIGACGDKKTVFNGIIDDLRIYNSVLSQANVQAIMADNPPAGAIREWLFDGGNNRGDVVCYDTRGETDESLWLRVYSEDHEFSGDCVMENGLIRVQIDEGTQFGILLFYWDGSSWVCPMDRLACYLYEDATLVTFPYLLSMAEMNRAESIQIRVRMCATADKNEVRHIEFLITLMRGKHHATLKIVSANLNSNVRFEYSNVDELRWAYCGDVESKGMGDNDLLSIVTNTEMTDNFMLNFDDDVSPVLGYLATNEKPAGEAGAFYTWNGLYISLLAVAYADFENTEIHCGLVPFRQIANLFMEAEDATLVGGVVNHFEDGFDIDSSGEYEGDISSFTWDTANSRILTIGAAKTMIRVDNLEWGAGTYEHKWTPKHAQASGSLVFCAGREVWPTNPCDPLNGYTAKFSGNTQTIYLYRLIAGSSVLLDSAPVTFVADTEYKITVHCHESAGVITVDVDDVEKLSVSSETTFTSGACGFGNATIVLSWFDSLSINAEEVESSGNSAVMLDAQYEDVLWYLPTDDLPVGRYLFICRVKDTAQSANDLGTRIWNYTDNRVLNEAGGWVYEDATSAYTYYVEVFDFIEADIGDNIRLRVRKATTSANTIVVDYILLIPIGDGESFPQDIAHSVLRTLTKKPKLVER